MIRTMIVLAVGTYGGMYLAQNCGGIPKLDSPGTLIENLRKSVEMRIDNLSEQEWIYLNVLGGALVLYFAMPTFLYKIAAIVILVFSMFKLNLLFVKQK